MKILFVAVFDDQGISSNTSQAMGLVKLGHEVSAYNYRERSLLLGGDSARDDELIQACKNIQPDLMIFAKCNDMSLDVFYKCKETTKVCYWFPDSLWAYSDRQEFVDKTVLSDMFCCDKKNVKEQAEKYNKNSFLVPDGFDSDLEIPRNLDQDIDVSFIGSIYGDREEKLSNLNMPVSVFSNAYGIMHSEIVSRSKINLNFCTQEGASDRIYKILGAGGFLLSDEWEGRLNMFEDRKHLVIFKDIEDLRKKIDFYMHNPDMRKTISEAGRNHVQKYSRDNWAKRLVECSLSLS
jgi:hypothetical protein